MATKTKPLTVQFSRDDEGWWIVEVRELPGCVTQAKTLATGRRRIKNAIATWLEDDNWEGKHHLDEANRLSKELRKPIGRVLSLRAKADAAAMELADFQRHAVKSLHKSGVGTRDIGELIELSHQRVAAVLKEKR